MISYSVLKPPIVAIVGPTGVGKTALSLKLARYFPMEVVGADSRQIYRGLDIGVAKPTPQERSLVPHHLIDVTDPTQEFSLVNYLDLARSAIQGIHNRGQLPVLVGGTGQYLWALLEGWRIPSVAPDPAYRLELATFVKQRGLEPLLERLAQVDPWAAANIDPHNQRRIIRAMEVYREKGIPWSKLRERGPEPFRACILGLTLPRETLYRRIDERVEQMVEMGWVDEVRNLIRLGVASTHSAMASIGYRELAGYINGEVDLKEVIRSIKANTHRFVRHQYSWFHLSDSRIQWLHAGENMEMKARSLVDRFLAETV